MPANRLGRRTALLAGAGGLASLLAACAGTGQPSSTAPGPSGTPSSPSTAPPSGTPSATTPTPTGSSTGSPSASGPLESGDRTRVRMALEKTEGMLAGLAALPLRRRRRPEVERLVALHTAHRSELMMLLEEPDAPLPEAPDPRLTVAEIPLREAGMQAELVSAALSADDGLVARLLASMSAGIAQWLATLPAQPTEDGGAAPSTSPSPTEAAA